MRALLLVMFVLLALAVALCLVGRARARAARGAVGGARGAKAPRGELPGVLFTFERGDPASFPAGETALTPAEGRTAVYASPRRSYALIRGAWPEDVAFGAAEHKETGRRVLFVEEKKPGAFAGLRVPGLLMTVSAAGFQVDPTRSLVTSQGSALMGAKELPRGESLPVVERARVASVFEELVKDPDVVLWAADGTAVGAQVSGAAVGAQASGA
jgi:hypothetical protein